MGTWKRFAVFWCAVRRTLIGQFYIIIDFMTIASLTDYWPIKIEDSSHTVVEGCENTSVRTERKVGENQNAFMKGIIMMFKLFRCAVWNYQQVWTHTLILSCHIDAAANCHSSIPYLKARFIQRKGKIIFIYISLLHTPITHQYYFLYIFFYIYNILRTEKCIFLQKIQVDFRT